MNSERFYKKIFQVNIPFFIRNSFPAILMVMGISMASAQSGYYNQAQTLYRNKNYYEAAQVFEKYLATEKHSRPRSTPFAIEKKEKGKANLDPHQEAVYQLATSYRLINDYQKAEKYYKESITFSEKAYPDARYWYAVTLRANQQYPQALEQITAFLEKHTQLDDLLMGADRELEDLKFIQMQAERANDAFRLQEVKGKDSSSGYALAIRHGDSLVYTAITQETSKEGEKWYMNSLFESINTEDPMDGAEPIDIPSESGIHEGMATFTRDGKGMFFTRWTKKNNQKSAQVYMSFNGPKGWSKPVAAPEPINLPGSNSAQPYMTEDGRFLLFSSDREGGSGGYDLWACSLDSNFEPVQIHNLGNVINSAGDEVAPYFHNKSHTLVFSSNGRIGMGGFDLYYAQGNFNMNGWDKPMNLGAPMNSSKDDIYFVSTDEENIWNTGWISSDRASECCLALFSVKGNNTQYVNGTVVDCQTRMPLPNAVLSVTDLRHPDRVLGKYKADTAGRYAFELHNSAHFKISASYTQYETSSLDVNLQQVRGRDSMMKAICLQPLVYPEKEIDKLLKALERNSHVGNFGYKKAILTDSAHDNLDSLAKVLKKFPQMVIEVDGYTDGIGGVAYNIRLAQKRVDACINYLLSLGVPKNQLEGKALGKCCPVAPDSLNGRDNPAGREMNRRVEYQVLRH